MLRSRFLSSAGQGLLLALTLGCATPQSAPETISLRRARLDVQVNRPFTNAALFKPHPAPFPSQIHTLAPLVIQEIARSSPSQEKARGRFGAVNAERIDLDRPAVYVQQGEVLISGQAHVQVGYAWCYQLPPGKPQVRGMRLTLNSSGEPVLWEPLSPEASEPVFYVAESLERAAAARRGPPLPGRRFSIERSATEQSTVLVARLIDDGPVPMGPMVYVQAEDNMISTILCRCMPAQVSQIVENQFYELLPIESLPDAAECRTDDTAAAAKALRALLAGQPPNDPALGPERHLRLPQPF
ncbi:MAG: hypothetical protein AB9869_03205 [Verrucomicrobiia bacterium]